MIPISGPTGLTNWPWPSLHCRRPHPNGRLVGTTIQFGEKDARLVIAP